MWWQQIIDNIYNWSGIINEAANIRTVYGKRLSKLGRIYLQNLLDEKNQEIDHLNDQVHQLQEELNKLSSGEEIVNLVSI
jgi:DNA anti-recombination protein RmuC